MDLKNAKYSTIAWPWTNVYGLSRSLVACSTLLILLFNDVNVIFKPVGVLKKDSAYIIESFFLKYSFFTLLGNSYLELAKWIAIGVLIIVILGIYPKITGILHFYITASFFSSAILLNGGDQIASILTFLFIPLTLTDPRKSHWESYSSKEKYTQKNFGYIILCLFAISAIWVIRLQISVIYLWSGIAKLGKTHWLNGTGLYYFFSHTGLGMPMWQQHLIRPIIANKVMALLITWSVPVFEIFLGMCLFINRKKYWKILLPVSLAFHIMIIFFFGLISFFFSMAACLVLYFVPSNYEFKFGEGKRFLKQKLNFIQI